MADALDQQIRSWLARYVKGEITLDEFAEWFSEATWDVHADHPADDLSGLVALRLAEFSNGDWTEAELRAAFRVMAPDWIVGQTLRADSADDPNREHGQFSVADRQSPVVYG